jgi:hypothetical protein
MINDDEKPIIESLKIPSTIVSEFESITKTSVLSGLVLVNTYLAWKKAKSEEAYKSILTSAFTTWSSNQGTPFIEIFTSLLSTS